MHPVSGQEADLTYAEREKEDGTEELIFDADGTYLRTSK